MRAPADESFGIRARQVFNESLIVSSDFGTELSVVTPEAARDAGAAFEGFMPASSVAQADKPPIKMAENSPNSTDRTFIDESSSIIGRRPWPWRADCQRYSGVECRTQDPLGIPHDALSPGIATR